MNKELDKIEMLIRSRRAVLDKIESDIKVKTVHRDNLENEKSSIHGQLTAARNNLDNIQALHIDRELRIKNDRSKLSEDKIKHLENVSAVLIEKSKIDKSSEYLLDKEIQIKKGFDILKSERIRLIKIQKDLDSKEIFLNNLRIKLDIQSKSIEDEKINLSKQIEDNNNFKKDVDGLRSQVICDNDSLVRQRQALVVEEKRLKDLNVEILKRAEDLESIKNETINKQKLLDDGFIALDNERMSHRRNVEDFKNSENALKVRQLRVIKIIRDKKIENELKMLESQEKKVK